jgi:hypothetical protein
MGGRGSGTGEVAHGSVREDFHKGERILISMVSVNESGTMKQCAPDSSFKVQLSPLFRKD